MRKTEKNSQKSKEKEKETEKKFPGYPKYPDSDDITRNNLRVSMNEEGLATTPENLSRNAATEDDIIVPSSRKRESDLTKEDLQALGPKDLSMDMGEDEELLKHRSQPVDFAGEDLDVPGAELDDASESIGTEDEENNNYSLGSDKHEDLDERHSL